MSRKSITDEKKEQKKLRFATLLCEGEALVSYPPPQENELDPPFLLDEYLHFNKYLTQANTRPRNLQEHRKNTNTIKKIL